METRRPPGPLPVVLIAAAMYFAASEAAIHLLPFRLDATVVWFASGIGLAALLVYGPMAAWGVALGALACGLVGERSLTHTFAFAAMTVGQLLLVWWLIVRVLRLDLTMQRVRDTLMLLVVIGTVSPLASALRSMAAVYLNTGHWPGGEQLIAAKVSSLGEAVGMLLLVPTALVWLRNACEPLAVRQRFEAAALYGVAVLLCLAVFGGLVRPMLAVESLPYALFPVMFWAAIRFGPRETASVFLVSGLIAIACTAKGQGPFSSAMISGRLVLEHLMSLYVFLCVLGGTGLLFAAGQRQLTASKAALRASEEQYRLLVENQTELVVRFDAHGLVTFASPSFMQYFGVQPGEIIGRPLARLQPDEAGAHEPAPATILQVHEDDRAAADAAWCSVCRAPFLGGVEMRVMTPAGWRWIAWSARATTCAAGTAESVIAVGRDVTDRHRAEEQARQHLQQLAHVGRVSSMGEMASAIAHEINQPLTAIANYTSACVRMLRAGKMGEEEALGAMQRVAAEAERAGEIVRKMRGFVRGEESQIGAVDTAFLVAEVLRLAGPEARQSQVALETDCPTPAPQVLADSIQIQQVLLNLVRNAVEAINSAECEERRVRIRTRADGEGGVEITVSDTGPGLDAEGLEKVFDAFFTTKADGIGIGLALSRSIADAHGGRLWASSDARGATFHLRLPAAPEHELAEH